VPFILGQVRLATLSNDEHYYKQTDNLPVCKSKITCEETYTAEMYSTI